MHFADELADQSIAACPGRGSPAAPLRLRDEKTLSGRPHIGSLRSASLHAFLAEVLVSRGRSVSFSYEINDTDAFDAVPAGVPASFKKYLGRSLFDVPCPDGSAENFAEYFAKDYCDTFEKLGFRAHFYRLSEKYKSGALDDAIRTALSKADAIRAIYKRVSGSEKPPGWLPLFVRCPACGSVGASVASGFDGETVGHECRGTPTFPGCGFRGRVSPFGGAATLPWKVEWAAKWKAFGVDIEAAGKDHYAAGGSRLVANAIAKEIFNIDHPFDIRHEFILTKSGAKMSSSAGRGLPADELPRLLPKAVARYLLLSRPPMKTILFEPEGDTLPLMFDEFDDAARQLASFQNAAEKPADENAKAAAAESEKSPPAEKSKTAADPAAENVAEMPAVKGPRARAFELAFEGAPAPPVSLPKFSQIALLSSLPHADPFAAAAAAAGRPLRPAEKEALTERLSVAADWLKKYAPEKYLFSFADHSQEASFSPEEKSYFKEIAAFLAGQPSGDAIQKQFHEIKTRDSLQPRALFAPFYRLFFGKESGPQLGFFMAAAGEEARALLEKASQ